MSQTPYEKVNALAKQYNMSVQDVLVDLLANDYITIDPANPQIVPTVKGYASGYFDSTGITTKAQIVETTDIYEISMAYFEGNLIVFRRNIKTDEIMIDTEGIAKALGYKNAHELLSTDASLDALNESKKETGRWPITTISN